jgi:hypothetical protein
MPNVQNMQLAGDVAINQGLFAEEHCPLTIPLQLDFTSATDINADLSQVMEQNRFRYLQTIYVDLSGTASALTITVAGAVNQKIVCKGRTQGYYAILAPLSPVVLSFNFTGAAIVPV